MTLASSSHVNGSGTRHHSYTIPSRGKSSAWSGAFDGKWMAVGLADAASKYARSGKSFSENKAELDRLATDLQSAIYRNSCKDVCYISRAIMHWGGVDNKHRQKRTFEWIERNADEIAYKLSSAVNLIKDEWAPLNSFDGADLIMNSTMTKIVSLADPEQKLMIYDGRIGGALGFFVARFAEEREIRQYDLADQLLFARIEEPSALPRRGRFIFRFCLAKQRPLPCFDGEMGLAIDLASCKRMPSQSARNRGRPVHVGLQRCRKITCVSSRRSEGSR